MPTLDAGALRRLANALDALTEAELNNAIDFSGHANQFGVIVGRADHDDSDVGVTIARALGDRGAPIYVVRFEG